MQESLLPLYLQQSYPVTRERGFLDHRLAELLDVFQSASMPLASEFDGEDRKFERESRIERASLCEIAHFRARTKAPQFLHVGQQL